MAPTKNDDSLVVELIQKAKVEELSDEDGIPFPGRHLTKSYLPTPPWLVPSSLDLFPEEHQTATSDAYTKVQAECLPHLLGEDTQDLPLNKYGIPHLRRAQHAAFLHASLGDLPSAYIALDAARPWVFYWAFSGLTVLGESVVQYRSRLINTVRPMQNPLGGFGGGHGQTSHCAASYACVLALAMVDALEHVNRRTIWHWLGKLKQPNGGFRMAENAEEDVRGAYCAFIMITVLNLPLELPPSSPARRAGLQRFDDKLGEYISTLQTWEGVIGASPPCCEAHGAYAFLALGTLAMIDAPHMIIPKYLDLPALFRWMALQQTSPEGGFAGRTNKLVDACYSQWIGGTWSLLQAALGPNAPEVQGKDLWNKAALVRYLLTCSQQPGKKGGMRDKPSTRPDGYHTTYALAGMSAAMNQYTYDAEGPVRDERGRLMAGFNWKAEGVEKKVLAGMGVEESGRVGYVHPVYVMPFDVVEGFREKFPSCGFEVEGAKSE
ncbi:CAAX farnesyltransferase (FTase) subunit beta [Oleoguttula sp. CCFEE 5521]